MDDVRKPINMGSARFMDQFRLFIRSHHLAYKTEKTYCHWVLRFIRFHNKQHPETMGSMEVEQFLEYLSTQLNVAASTQKTALNALVFLYDKFLKKRLGQLRFSYAKKPRLMPTVFSHSGRLR